MKMYSLPIYIFLNRLFWIFLVLEYGARGTPETLKRKNTGKYRLRSKVTLGNTIKSSPGVPHDTPPVNI